MTLELEHIHPQYRQFALLPDEARIRWVRSDRYLGYARAERVLERLEILIDYPTRDRMPCLLLFGAPGMGKTKILSKLLRDHPPIAKATGGTAVPVVCVQMPPEPDERSFYQELLRVMNGAFVASAPIPSMRQVARRLLRDLGTKLLVVDEVQSMLSGSSRQQRIFFNTLRFLTNDLRLPIVCAGTDAARVALMTDPQLADRFEAAELVGWTDDAEFHQLLRGISLILPLRKPSQLLDPAARQQILALTDGNTGRLFRLIETVAVEAISSGRECLDEGSFRQKGLVMPLLSMLDRSRRALAG
ncbi:TniB family NTP-binding protein [Pararhodobacter sp. CCB-MM2]|uniref:TniB family NTP-binding protein n=1 Tax=Pararhodobacter sp. CCB-MM2 TaxID=1786003 RepID=UPI0008345B66|nr:TniB family NTP-binding protein [Pararhodobacter sp. CCB-MM2]